MKFHTEYYGSNRGIDRPKMEGPIEQGCRLFEISTPQTFLKKKFCTPDNLLKIMFNAFLLINFPKTQNFSKI